MLISGLIILSLSKRTGSRFIGGTTWERYLDLQLTTHQDSIRFTRIHYGPIAAPDVLLTFDHPEGQIKLVYGPVANWSWDVIVYRSPLGR